MFCRSIKIVNRLGIHARPSCAIVEIVQKYKSEVWLRKENEKIRADSVLELMKAAICSDEIVDICAEGIDEQLVVEELGNLIEDGFKKCYCDE